MKNETIIKKIQKYIAKYNEQNSSNYLTLTESSIDVENIYVCIFDEDQIGLFKKYAKYSYRNYKDNYYNIYVGLDNGFTGIIQNNNSFNPGQEACGYLTNCTINKVMSYNDLRLKMYKARTEKNINHDKIPFNINATTSQEIIEVLNFALDYYQLNKDNLSQIQLTK